jgi:hypothetical protein
VNSETYLIAALAVSIITSIWWSVRYYSLESKYRKLYESYMARYLREDDDE